MIKLPIIIQADIDDEGWPYVFIEFMEDWGQFKKGSKYSQFEISLDDGYLFFYAYRYGDDGNIEEVKYDISLVDDNSQALLELINNSVWGIGFPNFPKIPAS